MNPERFTRCARVLPEPAPAKLERCRRPELSGALADRSPSGVKGADLGDMPRHREEGERSEHHRREKRHADQPKQRPVARVGRCLPRPTTTRADLSL
jgi:hypothetical protein